MPYTWKDSKGKKYILIRAKPSSKSSLVKGTTGLDSIYPVSFALLVHIKSAAIKNEANEELLSVVSKYLGVARKNLSIVSGAKTKTKVVAIKS